MDHAESGQSYNLAKGEYYIQVYDTASNVTTGGSGVTVIRSITEAFDNYGFSIVYDGGPSDLTASILSVSPTTMTPGQPITINSRISNSGAAAGAISVIFCRPTRSTMPTTGCCCSPACQIQFRSTDISSQRQLNLPTIWKCRPIISSRLPISIIRLSRRTKTTTLPTRPPSRLRPAPPKSQCSVTVKISPTAT